MNLIQERDRLEDMRQVAEKTIIAHLDDNNSSYDLQRPAG